MQRFSDRTVLVTGAASGIGRAVAQRIAREAGNVFCVDVNSELLQETVGLISAEGLGVAESRVCDVSDPKSVTETVQACVDTFGSLYSIINMAGLLRFDDTEQLLLEDWDHIIAVNLTGTLLFCKAAIPHLLESRGSIVNAASEHGVEDYIGTNFPKWKEAEDYRPYPDSKNTKISREDEAFTFTLELLERCRKYSKPLDIERLVGFGGKKVEDELQLIRLEEIHEPLRPVTDSKGKIVKKYHRGFQTRAISDTDPKTIEDISEDIVKGAWEERASQPSVFILPKKYQYEIETDDGRRVTVKYGIVNGTHRWYGATEAGEEYFIAWILDLPLTRLKQYATAVCNAPKDASSGSSNDRSFECIVNSVNDEYVQGETDFAIRLKDANENRIEKPEQVILEHLQHPIFGYGCRSRELNKLVKAIIGATGVVEEFSRWSAAQYAAHYAEHSPTTVKSVGRKNENKFFNELTNVTTFINKDDTKLYDSITLKIAEQAISDYDKYNHCRPIEICDLVPKDTKFDYSNRDEVRMRPVNKVHENISIIRRFVHLVDNKLSPNIIFTAAPQLDKEKENGLLPLEVYPNKDRNINIS